MKRQHILTAGALVALMGLSGGAIAAGGDMGQTVKQATNWTAIGMFLVFVVATLFITKWAAAKTKSAAAFYTGGGGITGCWGNGAIEMGMRPQTLPLISMSNW